MIKTNTTIITFRIYGRFTDCRKINYNNTVCGLYECISDTRNLTLTTSRSDVDVLAVVNPSTKQGCFLLNTQKDYYVNPQVSAEAKEVN